MGLQFSISGGQIDGARDYQEDAFLITHLTDKDGGSSCLVIVADGMGGHAAGNVASNMAVQAFNNHFSSHYPTEKIPKVLKQSINKANNAITETVKETPALEGMGCTMVSALFENGKMWRISVGDSHLYLLRDRQLVKQNADHSYGGYLDRLAAEGKPVESGPVLSRNMLMSGLTGDEIPDIDCPNTPVELQAGDRIIICSDGLDTLSAGKIIRFSGKSPTPKECSQALLKAVDEADVPRQDNTTIVVIDVVEKEEQAAAEIVQEKSPAIREQPQPVQQPAPITVRERPIEQRPLKINVGVVLGIVGFALVASAALTYFLFNPIQVTVRTASPTIKPVETIEVERAPVTEPEVSLPKHPEATTPAPTEPPETLESEQRASEDIAMVEQPVKPEPVVDVAKAFRDAFGGGGFGPEMIPIPGGTFEMGSPSTSVNFDERPRHEVHVRPFAMSKYETTGAEYNQFARATRRPTIKSPGDKFPATFVSWHDANAYAKWLSKMTGENYRLPSEAEWEYAASGRQTTPYWWGFDTEEVDAYCFGCTSEMAPRQPTTVGRFKANQFGLYDTAGNVSEWVEDCHHPNYEEAPADGKVWSGGDCSLRIARGGAYTSPPPSLRSAKRDQFDPNSPYDFIGIRLVRDIY
ncbi:MAG: SUMF1/EgtB/PvdO family nonheme iron enzyme [Gammaproteobacteria bacterium]|nr:SUMF1/EgtB/PvdO family nonheme iron enzyme [Gammaproteobacteria bacterium]MCI0591475.1 SUMF1/EgtB/PvdO family nonheme iron enzyme [Gammaproteobacteria bacterium]